MKKLAFYAQVRESASKPGKLDVIATTTRKPPDPKGWVIHFDIDVADDAFQPQIKGLVETTEGWSEREAKEALRFIATLQKP